MYMSLLAAVSHGGIRMERGGEGGVSKPPLPLPPQCRYAGMDGGGGGGGEHAIYWYLLYTVGVEMGRRVDS